MDDVPTGALIELTHAASGLKVRALAETRREGDAGLALSLLRVERPTERLRVAQGGSVAWASGAAAKSAAFLLDRDADAPHSVHLRPAAHLKKGWHLGVSCAVADAPELVGDALKGDASRFSLCVIARLAELTINTSATAMMAANAMGAASPLLLSQRRAFMADGFLLVRAAVPLALVRAARRRINHELGVPGRVIAGGVEGAAKLAGAASNSDEVRALFLRSGAAAMAEALLGAGQMVPPAGAQLALRFPELGDARDPTGTEWHTDGLRQGKRRPFSLLAGIALSDATEPLAGNLTVFPGSHLALQPLLTKDGRLRGHEDECFRPEGVWGQGSLPDLGAPLQLAMAPGDLVLAHPDLAHRGGPNFSPDVRYQVYFRLKHRRFEPAVTSEEEDGGYDMWRDFGGLRDLVEPSTE